MSKEYTPELGQACFGQPTQRLELPWHVDNALISLAHAWSVCRTEPSPFENNGCERFTFLTFDVEGYSWNEDYNQEFNFKWKDIRISWYKYLGRGMSINRDMTKDESAVMLKECMTSLMEETI